MIVDFNYKQYIGKNVKVTCSDGNTVSGKMMGYDYDYDYDDNDKLYAEIAIQEKDGTFTGLENSEMEKIEIIE